MHITFSPARRDDALALSRNGDVLTINGTDFDFGPLPDGASLPMAAVGCNLLAGDVERIEGVLHLALILPLGRNPSEEARFPDPITVAGDGPISLPATDIEGAAE